MSHDVAYMALIAIMIVILGVVFGRGAPAEPTPLRNRVVRKPS
jgi:hypothetical protein